MSTANIVFMPHLNALRAFAVMAVAYYHWAPWKYQLGIPWGTAGVQLFFVLSGFLITGILINAVEKAEKTKASKAKIIRSFIIRRALRIFPLYFTVIIIAYAVDLWPFRGTMPWHIFYLSNIYFFIRQDWAGTASHLWSLSVEEQFYLIWPWLAIYATKKLIAVSWLIIAVSIVVLFASELLLNSMRLVWVLPVPAFLAICLGALLAITRHYHSEKVSMYLTVCKASFIIFVLFASLKIFTPYDSPVIDVMIKVSMIFFFVWVVDKGSRGYSGFFGRICDNKIILELGKVSYGLYLIHNFTPAIIGWLYRSGFIPEVLYTDFGLLIKLILTVILAFISWHLLEQPMNRLKKYFPYIYQNRQSNSN